MSIHAPAQGDEGLGQDPGEVGSAWADHQKIFRPGHQKMETLGWNDGRGGGGVRNIDYTKCKAPLTVVITPSSRLRSIILAGLLYGLSLVRFAQADADSCAIPSSGTFTLEFPTLLHLNTCSQDSPCGECAGDCNNDDDCEGDLKCFNIHTANAGMSVPGCQMTFEALSGNPASGGQGDPYLTDFCYDPSKAADQSKKMIIGGKTKSKNLCSSRSDQIYDTFADAIAECLSDDNCGGISDWECNGSDYKICLFTNPMEVDRESGRHETGITYDTASSDVCTWSKPAGWGTTGCASMGEIKVSDSLTVQYDDSNPSYITGVLRGTYGCPTGSVHIESVEECQSAAALVGTHRSWGGEGAFENSVNGCMVRSNGDSGPHKDSVYWNTATGSGSTQGISICRRAHFPTIQPGVKSHRLFSVPSGDTLTLTKVRLKTWTALSGTGDSWCGGNPANTDCYGGLIALGDEARLVGSFVTMTGPGTSSSSLRTASHGGAVSIGDRSRFEFEDMMCSGFYVSHYGGCFSTAHQYDWQIECIRCSFVNNRAREGGAIYAKQHNGVFTLTDSTIQGNSASYGGGIYFIDSRSVTLTRVVFDSNTAGNSGGGAYGGTFKGGSYKWTIQESTFSGNKARGSDTSGGGALFIPATGTAIVTGATFTNNSARRKGGAILSLGALDLRVGKPARISVWCHLQHGSPRRGSALGQAHTAFCHEIVHLLAGKNTVAACGHVCALF